MRQGFFLYRCGAFGIFLSLGVFGNKPILNEIKQDRSHWLTLLILFGFVIVAGLILFLVRRHWLEQNNRILLQVSHGLAFLSILWILLWCFVWLAVVSSRGQSAQGIEKMAYFHLFGVSFSMAGYVLGWRESRYGRSTLFLMTVGWTISYMAWVNLYLQPQLEWLWAPAVGGLGVTLGAFLMARSLKAKVETLAELT